MAADSYFLWENDRIIGLFRLRKSLTEKLRTGSGHVGYYIGRAYRGQGYATKGLALLIEKARDILKEDEIYLSCNISNPASLAVQQKNGAYLHHSDVDHHYTRIPLR